MIIAHKNPTKRRGLSLFEWANKGGGLLFACFVGNGESVGQLGIHEKGVLLSCFFATVPVLRTIRWYLAVFNDSDQRSFSVSGVGQNSVSTFSTRGPSRWP